MEKEYLKLSYEYSKKKGKDEYDISIYPEYWFDEEDIELKIKILKRAIQENKLIKDVKDGSLFVEGIIN